MQTTFYVSQNKSSMTNVNNPAWISNYIHYNVWDEITYPFLKFNSATVEVQEWISNFIPYLLSMWLFIHVGIKVNPY